MLIAQVVIDTLKKKKCKEREKNTKTGVSMFTVSIPSTGKKSSSNMCIGGHPIRHVLHLGSNDELHNKRTRSTDQNALARVTIICHHLKPVVYLKHQSEVWLR